MNGLHVHHQPAVPRRLVVAIVALEFVLLEVDDVDVFLDGVPVEVFEASRALNATKD